MLLCNNHSSSTMFGDHCCFTAINDCQYPVLFEASRSMSEMGPAINRGSHQSQN